MPGDGRARPLYRPTRRERMLYRAARILAPLPDAIKIRLSREPAVIVDAQQLDPQLQVIRSATHGRKMPGLIEPTIAAGRERYRRQTDVFRGPATPVAAVRGIEIPAGSGVLLARHYAPAPERRTRTASASARHPHAAPITVYFHGGGFVIGDLDTHDEPCRMLCRHAGVHVLSVAYRLAPEHPFPAALDDAAASLAWTRENAASLGADPSCVAVGGDSAGGNLAAVLAARRDLAPAAQLLIYPATDFASTRRSLDLFGEGFYLTHRDMDAFRDAYLSGAGVAFDDPRVSPLRASRFADLPPALVVVAGFDPLRDDGAEYAGAMARAGVHVRTLRYASLGHGFIHLTGVAPAARRAVIEIAREWRALLRRGHARDADVRATTSTG